MKNIFLAGFCMMLSMLSFGQDWTPEQKEVIQKFELNERDHRGVIFYSETANTFQFQTISEAITSFFESSSVLDITKITVKDMEGFNSLEGKILDIQQLINLYLQLNK